jgi:hypothetical protein
MRKLEQKHIDTIKMMIDANWKLIPIDEVEYELGYEPHTGKLAIFINEPWNDDKPHCEYLFVGKELHELHDEPDGLSPDGLWEVLWQFWDDFSYIIGPKSMKEIFNV